jgi:hypothetical protein
MSTTSNKDALAPPTRRPSQLLEANRVFALSLTETWGTREPRAPADEPKP